MRVRAASASTGRPAGPRGTRWGATGRPQGPAGRAKSRRERRGHRACSPAPTPERRGVCCSRVSHRPRGLGTVPEAGPCAPTRSADRKPSPRPTALPTPLACPTGVPLCRCHAAHATSQGVSLQDDGLRGLSCGLRAGRLHAACQGRLEGPCPRRAALSQEELSRFPNHHRDEGTRGSRLRAPIVTASASDVAQSPLARACHGPSAWGL